VLRTLVPVQGNVGGVEVEDDLPGRRLAVRLEEEADEQRLDRGRVVADAMVAAGRAGGRVFEPVQRALAGQRRAVAAPGRKLAGEHRQHRIVAEVIVIEHVLMPERDAEDALADQRGNLALDTLRHSAIAKAGSEPPDQVDRAAVAPSSSAPAFEVIAPPSKDATTRRPSTGAKSNSAGLHSVCIGDPSCGAASLRRRGTFADSGPRCTYAW